MGFSFRYFCVLLKALFGVFLSIGVLTNSILAQRTELSPQAINWADSICNTISLEQKVSQLFVIDARDEASIAKLIKLDYPPAFVLGSVDISAKKWPKYSTTLPPVLIPDLRLGFESGISGLPFPDEKTMKFMDEKSQIGLFIHLYKWLDVNKYKAFFAGNNYLSNSNNPVTSETSILFPFAFAQDKFPLAISINVHEIPKALISSLPTLQLNEIRGVSENVKSEISYFSRKITFPDISIERLLQHGNVFLTSDYEFDYNRILFAIKDKWLTTESLDNTVKHILAFKYELQQQKSQEIVNPLNTLETELRWGYESAIGILQSSDKPIFPLVNLNLNVGFLSDGEGYFEEFKSMASNYIPYDNATKDPSEYDLVFWLVAPSFSFETPIQEKIIEIRNRFPKASLIMIRSGNVSDLPFHDLTSDLDALVITPSNLPFSWSAMAQAFFNGVPISKKEIKTGISKSLSEKSVTMPSTRLKYGIPDEVNMNSDTLTLINGIVEEAIRKSAIPGAQVMVVKNGVVVFNKNYGWVNYSKNRMVSGDVIYDLASVTKVMTTLPVLMQQYDNGRWRLHNKLSDFVPQADSTDKRNITMRQLLLHESGLPAFISFYTEAIDISKLKGNLFSNRRSSSHTIKLEDRLYMNKSAVYRDDVFRSTYDLNFSVPVANNLFMNVFYLDSMLFRMLRAKTDVNPKYRYSDLNFLFLQRISENLAQESIDEVALNNFYKPMGAASLSFNPWKNVPLDQIAPTENDLVFRHQLLHGYVHDPGAAMFGGIAGHAGLFGNANDLAKMSQMYLNKGLYGGYRYLNEETVDFFTAQQNPSNRRGLGFDKPENIPVKNGSVSDFASPFSFGHTGFTGTIVWIDPVYDIIYIFLSNRIHPHTYNKKLMEMGVRPKIQDVIYRSMNQLAPISTAPIPME